MHALVFPFIQRASTQTHKHTHTPNTHHDHQQHHDHKDTHHTEQHTTSHGDRQRETDRERRKRRRDRKRDERRRDKTRTQETHYTVAFSVFFYFLLCKNLLHPCATMSFGNRTLHGRLCESSYHSSFDLAGRDFETLCSMRLITTQSANRPYEKNLATLL